MKSIVMQCTGIRCQYVLGKKTRHIWPSLTSDLHQSCDKICSKSTGMPTPSSKRMAIITLGEHADTTRNDRHNDFYKPITEHFVNGKQPRRTVFYMSSMFTNQ